MADAVAASPTLARVARGHLCAGCGLCAAVAGPAAVGMALSEDGYLRPRQVGPLSDQKEDVVSKVCPAVGVEQTSGQGQDHDLWGRVVQVRTGHASDAALRHHASSGGALSAVAQFLLESGEVDFVVQTAMDAASPILNVTVESRNAGEVYAAAGSRYGPSAPLARLEQHLAAPGRFAFVGKPCDVAALRALARLDGRVNEKVPYLLSFFCAGIPSVHGTRRVLDRLGAPEAELKSFRYRGDGWPGHAAAELGDGRTLAMTYARSWGDILSSHIQFRCKICPDGTGGLADIAFADAWHCDEAGYPLFEEEEGQSLIVTRTQAGQDLLEKAVRAGCLRTKPADISAVEPMQPGQASRKRLVLARLAALAVLGRPVPRYRGFRLFRAARRAGLRELARNFLGTARRVMVRRVHN